METLSSSANLGAEPSFRSDSPGAVNDDVDEVAGSKSDEDQGDTYGGVFYNPARRSLREEAASLKHKLSLEMLLLDHCDSCMRGKSRNVRK